MRVIFYADDDVDDIALFERALHETNPAAAFVSHENGTGLIRYLENDSHATPEVIFLDINMPDKNGFEVLGALKDNPRFKTIPVVVLTTSAQRDDIDRMRQLGATLFVTKPTDYNDLKNTIDKILNQPGILSTSLREKFVLEN